MFGVFLESNIWETLLVEIYAEDAKQYKQQIKLHMQRLLAIYIKTTTQ